MQSGTYKPLKPRLSKSNKKRGAIMSFYIKYDWGILLRQERVSDPHIMPLWGPVLREKHRPRRSGISENSMDVSQRKQMIRTIILLDAFRGNPETGCIRQILSQKNAVPGAMLSLIDESPETAGRDMHPYIGYRAHSLLF